MLDQSRNHVAPTIYAAIELSKKSWVVAILRPERDQPSIHRIKGGALSELIAKLRAAACNGERLRVCYTRRATTGFGLPARWARRDHMLGSRSSQPASQSQGAQSQDRQDRCPDARTSDRRRRPR